MEAVVDLPIFSVDDRIEHVGHDAAAGVGTLAVSTAVPSDELEPAARHHSINLPFDDLDEVVGANPCLLVGNRSLGKHRPACGRICAVLPRGTSEIIQHLAIIDNVRPDAIFLHAVKPSVDRLVHPVMLAKGQDDNRSPVHGKRHRGSAAVIAGATVIGDRGAKVSGEAVSEA